MFKWLTENPKIAIVLLIVLGGVSYGGIAFTSSPMFCSQTICHEEMEPELLSWQKTTHFENGVSCQHCHYGPGLMGFVKVKIGGMVQALHHFQGNVGEPYEELKGYLVEELGFERSKIPTQIKRMVNGEARGIFIHRDKADYTPYSNVNYRCRNCHSYIADYLVTNGLLEEPDVAKDVPLAPEPSQSPKRWDDRTFNAVSGVKIPHATHVDRGVYCTECHIEVAHGNSPPDNMPTMWICFRCHNNETAFRDDCRRCHIRQSAMFKGEGASSDVEPTEAYMNGQVECVDCHMADDDYRPDINQCNECHDDGYSDMVAEWQTSVRKQVAKLEPLFASVYQGMSRAKDTGRNTMKSKRLYDEAKRNFDFVKADRSYGVHNIDYIESMLDSATDKLRKASDALYSSK